MVEWEQKLVMQTAKEQREATAFYSTQKALALMDVPPYNSQSPMLYPVLQKLFNITTDKITIQNFTMFDKNGQPYVPASGGRPAV